MNKFTPGPWHITLDTTPGEFVTLTKVRDRHQSVVAVMHVDAAANAKLISAAPELLEILTEISNHVVANDKGTFEIAPDYIRHARTAITKAT